MEVSVNEEMCGTDTTKGLVSALTLRTIVSADVAAGHMLQHFEQCYFPYVLVFYPERLPR